MNKLKSISEHLPNNNASFAAIGGGGGGTLLLTLAQSLPDNNKFKSILILIAPAVSVTLNYFWIWISSEYSKNRIDKIKQRKIEEIRNSLINRIKNDNTPKHMIDKYKKQLEILEDNAFQLNLEILESR